ASPLHSIIAHIARSPQGKECPVAFVPGYSQAASWQATGAGAATTLNITSHSWQEEVDKLDVTHSGSAGVQALLAGIGRGSGTIEANYDAAAIPSNTPPNIKAGAKGVLRL